MCRSSSNLDLCFTVTPETESAGVLMSKVELQRAHKLCEQAGAWLVVDNTYEHFTYDGREHTCVSGPHVINIFSMSKVRCHCHAGMCMLKHLSPTSCASFKHMVTDPGLPYCSRTGAMCILICVADFSFGQLSVFCV